MCPPGWWGEVGISAGGKPLIDELKFTPAFTGTTLLVEGKRRKSQLSFVMARREERLSEQELLLPFPALYKWLLNGMFCSLLHVVSSQPQTGARLGSCGDASQGRRTFLLQPYTNPKTPPEIKRTLHWAVKMQLPLGRSRHLVRWILSHCLSLLAELLCKLQAVTTFGWRSRKPSLVRNPCPLPRLNRPCLQPRWQSRQHCRGFSLVAGTW